MAKGHNTRAHALLSASGASRWINCTPSALLEEKFPQEDSVFAKEGTMAHELAEFILADKTKTEAYYTHYEKIVEAGYDFSEMEAEVQKYTGYVLEQLGAAKRKVEGSLLMLEEKVDLRAYIQEGFGTCDAIIVSDDEMEIIDLKYGKGVRVSAEDNSQLKLYALGALEAVELSYDIKQVKLTIAQPRLDSISSWNISVEDLKKWGENTVKPKAEEAYEGKGLQVCGDWCKWCRAKARCATLASQNLKVAKHDFKDPHLLTDSQLLEVFKQFERISDWIGAVSEHILKEAIAGKQWQGYKLVEGRSVRKWVDEVQVFQILTQELKYNSEDVTKAKLLGLTDMEKLLGKQVFADRLGPFIIKPQGAPTLAPEADKRPALGIEQAKKDFAE